MRYRCFRLTGLIAPIGEFIKSGTVQGLDTSCVLATKRPPFVIGAAVP